jgi:transcriptional regulator with XRE-family HTH domain
LDIAERLRELRRAKRIRQGHIAKNLDLSVSEISRIERGRRRLRVDQLAAWARCLGFRIELIFWEPARGQDLAITLSDDERRVLTEVAASLRHMPRPAREALVHEMALWRQEAAAK